MIAWMLYCGVAGALVAIAARCAERVARVAGTPIRWIWVAGMAVTVILGALAPLRRIPAELEPTPASAGMSIDALQLQTGLDAVGRRLPTSSVLFVATAWSVASGVLLAIIVGVHARLRAARRRWPVATLHGMRVRVSPDTGPLVIGVGRPEIVVPRWVLDRDPIEQRLIVGHEAEHVRAHDALLLGGGILAAALTPWNPAVWYMFSRLRLAVELDCDARVLAHGVSVESYGSLLLDVATHASPLRFGAPALANSPSHLYSRIIAMQRSVPRYALARAVAAGVVGVAALLAACETRMPTAAEVEALDVRAAEEGLGSFIAQADEIEAIYRVDDRRVPREEALALRSEEVEAVEVVRLRGQPTIAITTRDGSEFRGRIATRAPTSQARGEPLVLIDGKRSTAADIPTIDRTEILSIEILKGRAASTLGYDPAEVANGVIIITTKRAGTAR